MRNAALPKLALVPPPPASTWRVLFMPESIEPGSRLRFESIPPQGTHRGRYREPAVFEVLGFYRHGIMHRGRPRQYWMAGAAQDWAKLAKCRRPGRGAAAQRPVPVRLLPLVAAVSALHVVRTPAPEETVAVLPKSRAIALSPHFPGYAKAHRVAGAQVVPRPGKSDIIVLPMRDASWRFVRAHVPGLTPPAVRCYDWKHIKPFAAQVETLGLLTTERRAMCLNDMGTGKTIATLAALDWLIRCGDAKRALVVAPLSTLRSVWEMECLRFTPHLRPVVLHGVAARRKELLAADSKLFIINHDGVGVVLDELLKRFDIDVLIVDELAVCRNGRTQRWKRLFGLGQRMGWLWGLTGSPTPNAPTDAWAQARLIKGWGFDVRFTTFRDLTMQQLGPFKWVEREGARDAVATILQPSVRFAREDCIDLPPVMHSTRDAPLEPVQRMAYDQMRHEMLLELKDKTITAANAGVLLNKLVQIANGFAYSTEGEPTWLGLGNKYEVLKELLDEHHGKALVFGPYRALVDALAEQLRLDYGADAVVEVTGGTALGARTLAYQRFQAPGNPRLLVAHPGTMAHGVNLTAASLIIWYAPSTSHETTVQANARASRPGQTRSVHIVRLQSAAVESKLYHRLDHKKTAQDLLLEVLHTKV